MSVGLVISSWMGVAAGSGPSRLVTPFTPEVALRAVNPEQIIEATRLSPAAGLMLIIASLVAGAALLGGAFWWWRAKSETPKDAAFRMLASRLRLRPEERALVQTLARERRIAPAGLLVSLDTLRCGLAGARSGGEEAARAWLAKRCG